MGYDIALSRARLLIQQRRYSDAEKELSQFLALHPNDVHVLALMAEVNLQQDKLVNAMSIVQTAIGFAPDSADLFYLRSRIEINLDSFDAAESSLQQAIALDPLDSAFYGLYASIKLARKDFEEALQYANKALELDAENLFALNSRSTALSKLNRKEESFQTIEGALREDPNNAWTHANYGWNLLEKGDHVKALEHFKEALKNDPQLEHAQNGMREALKATNFFYRWFLKYAFWMGNLKGRGQWIAIIGFSLGFRALRTAAAQDTAIQPLLIALAVIAGLFLYSTWVLEPLSNLLLRFNKYGVALLSEDEKRCSNLVATALASAAISVLLFFAFQHSAFLFFALYCFIMSIPLSRMYGDRENQQKFKYFAVALGIIGFIGILVSLYSGEIFNLFSTLFILGFVIYQWMANYWSIKENNI